MVRPLFVLIIVIEKKFYLELNNNYNKETYNVHQLKYNKMTNYVKAKVTGDGVQTDLHIKSIIIVCTNGLSWPFKFV